MIAYRYEYDGSDLICHELNVTKQTPCGYWVDADAFGYKKKFVLNTTTKKYAYLSKHDALISYIHRKENQISILNNRLLDAYKGLEIARSISV